MAQRIASEGYGSDGAWETRWEEYDPAQENVQGAASSFMSEWRDNLGESKRLYENTEASINNYAKYEAELGKEYELLEERFGGLRDDLITTSREDLEKRNIMGGMFMDAAKADYEGASAEAIGDIAGQAQRGREMQTRSDLARGMDPTSGASRTAKSKSYLNEAIGKVLASNSARNNEKLRTGAMAAQGMGLFDPNITGGLALNIQNAGSNLKVGQSNIAGNVVGMNNNLANSFTQNVTAPAGDTAGTLYGMSLNPSAVGGGGGGSSTTYGGVMNPGFWDESPSAPEKKDEPIRYGGSTEDGTYGML